MKKFIGLIIFISILSGHFFVYADDSQPRGLTAVAGNNVVYLNWSKPKAEIKGYWVYRALPDGEYQKINTALVTENFYKDETVVNKQQYWYTVTAIDTKGNESLQSEDVSATPDASATPMSGY